MNIDKKGKDILILGKRPTQGLNHTLAAETQYSFNFTRPGIKFCLSLHYNGSNIFLLVNTTKMYQFKVKDSEIEKYHLRLGNNSKGFTANNMKKTVLSGYVYQFYVDYDIIIIIIIIIINTSNIVNIHKYLMKNMYYQIMFGLIKKILMGLVINIVNASNYTKYVSLSNQKCEIQPTLTNLHPNEYSQEFYYYSLPVKLDRCVGGCNTLNDLTTKVCIPNKTEDLNLSVFNIIAGINELKTLTKHISCECKCKFDGTKCTSNQWWNNNKG